MINYHGLFVIAYVVDIVFNINVEKESLSSLKIETTFEKLLQFEIYKTPFFQKYDILKSMISSLELCIENVFPIIKKLIFGFPTSILCLK